MKLETALPIAERCKALLAPYCERIEIAGSIRRRKPEVGDIELVCIPRTCDLISFCDTVRKWIKIKGEPSGKYTQRLIQCPNGIGIKLDLFMATPQNWGLIYAIRTGSAAFSHKVLASGWVRNGYHSQDGMLHNTKGLGTPKPVPVQEEEDLFNLIGLRYVAPEYREV